MPNTKGPLVLVHVTREDARVLKMNVTPPTAAQIAATGISNAILDVNISINGVETPPNSSMCKLLISL
jgi:hypothetical protein